MPKLAARSTQALIDVLVLSLAYWAAFVVRFDGIPPLQMIKRLMFTWPYVVGFQFFVLSVAGVPRFVWRYVGLAEAKRIFFAMTGAAAVLLGIRYLSLEIKPYFGYIQYAFIPAGIILIDQMLGFLAVAGVRVIARLRAERADSNHLRRSSIVEVPTLLVGAGQAGVIVAREIANRPDLGIKAVGFIDDDPYKQRAVIQGLPVLGPVRKIAEIAKRRGATQVLVTIANARGEPLRRIASFCEQANLGVKVIPGIYELLEGKASLSRIRPVSIDDLLGREAIHLETDLLERFIRGKRVLVTGAGGSIGSELCRQVARLQPSMLVLVERSEFHLFTIHQELIAAFPKLVVRPRICDVSDRDRMHTVFGEDKPQVVFHAAAHKHVPMMEWNPGEAIKNNVFGTKLAADMAHEFGAEAFVLISTDKAVNPTSIMGATKRVAEMYVQSLSQQSSTKFVAVRFGNVLGSAGSVIPIFQAQIAAGGPIKVTHPDMKRYFMTIPEASQLVMQAAAMGQGGEIFVLDMGEPVKIVDLARDLIRLSGLEPETDIRIEFTGVRPGEKLFEEFGFDAEKMVKTRHDKIYVGKLQPSGLEQMQRHLEWLQSYAPSTSTEQVRAALARVVPEMQPDVLRQSPSATEAVEAATSPDVPTPALPAPATA